MTTSPRTDRIDRTTQPPARSEAASDPWRRDLTTVGLGALMIVGIFADGWSHLNLESSTESFFTPSHGLLYAGFLATAAWIAWQSYRAASRTRRWSALPHGYGMGLGGTLVFGAGGLGDLLWHTSLGIEVSVEALLSPTHLLLMTGALFVLLVAPVAAARRLGAGPGFRALLPALLGVSLATALVAFFLSFAWGVVDPAPSAAVPAAALDEQAAGHFEAERMLGSGILTRLITTAVLLTPILMLVRRWWLPFGSLTLFFAIVNGLVAVLYAGLAPLSLTLGALLVGLLADVLLALLGPQLRSRGRLLTFAAGVPAALWAVNFGVLAVSEAVRWPPELWSGTIVLAAGTGAALALLSSRTGAGRSSDAHASPSASWTART